MTHFDPDAGVLRLRHGDLAVLAVLAVEPASTRLHDHAVAPHLATLRATGLLGPGGVEPSVAPLAAAVGAARVSGTLEADDHGQPRRARLWVGEALGVVGVAVPESPAGEDAYELMADTPDRLVDLLGELVGLGTAPPPPVPGEVTVDAAALAGLLAAGQRVDTGDVAAAADREADDPWARALRDGLVGAPLRWRLQAQRDGAAPGTLLDLTVLDAGAAGLWRIHWDAPRAAVAATRPSEVRAALAALADPAA
ncbi:MAG: hypothetical protein R6T85_01015 [Egibacteraceae bacterium]